MKTVSHNAYDYLYEIDNFSQRHSKIKKGIKTFAYLCLFSMGALIITKICKTIKA